MKLSEKDVKLYYDLMFALYVHVNRELKIHPGIIHLDDLDDCSMEEKVDIRNAVFEHIGLIDSFVQENPQKLSEEELQIVSSWKNFVSGDFYIERVLKKYTVFIQDDQVYGVFGLYQGFDEMTLHAHLPLYVNAVLLPFKGKIIYDGFMGTHRIFFGGGVKRRLKETYMRAKQNGRIIDSLESNREVKKKKPPAKPLKNWKPELDELAGRVKKLRGSADHPALYSPAFSLVRASVEFAQIAVSEAGDPNSLYRAYKKVSRAFQKAGTVLYREEF